MKNLSKALLCSIAVFGLLAGSVSAESLKQKSVSNDISVMAGVTYRDLKVSHSVMLLGTSFKLVSGADVVSLSPNGLVTGRSPGDAIIYAYKNGSLYWKHYIRVID
ncbi:hypothetical protein M5W83_13925 [Paenibacillus thiaminolyticus]|uniref:BIG2 domain-containing protein n=1 Tax=Paenibacillus thiaminolyticus TaxID=49283 RepID=A0AAP9DVV6_PANTH|nr:hypothetical protein [Paenibacillus thiaminolyticus]MCY9534299.1 hypothetical protein [Paenibacillus thiaminolyticus]MCY9603010.1 hypothetical protein [Paenibacillus thiaminolyticus]MCY9608241.1 hypothetical protein [Paenibacillus thiaminolyticus]MCY9611609.1 hypothetical protein [Paenibacillus thiaminolyticus]MCY9618263.1 hypothetical protein [Paenibacillus thiaminolyticus]